MYPSYNTAFAIFSTVSKFTSSPVFAAGHSSQFTLLREQFFQGTLEGWDAVLHFVVEQLLEYLALQMQPRCIGIMRVHHLLPNLNWQAVGSFAVPGYLCRLQPAVVFGVEDGSAEHHGE